MSRRYVVLRSDPGDVTFLETFQEALNVLAGGTGLVFGFGFDEGAYGGLVRHVYPDVSGLATISIVDDFTTPVRYLMIEGDLGDQVDPVMLWAREQLPAIPIEELQSVARLHLAGDPQALVRLALATADVVDDVTWDIVSMALQHPDDLIRFRAAEAAALTQWPEFLPELQRRVESDTSPEVREMAIVAIEACRRRDEP